MNSSRLGRFGPVAARYDYQIARALLESLVGRER